MSFYLKVRLLDLVLSYGVHWESPGTLKNFGLGAGLGIPSEPRSSKVRLIFLISNRMTSSIHAQNQTLRMESSNTKAWG